jgi:rod shape-determining protein MreD
MDGLLVGFFSGLLVDFCFGNVIGMCALIYMFIGYINGYSNKIFDMNDMTVPIIIIGVSEFVYFFLYYVFEFLLRGKLAFFFYFTRIGLPEIIYTVFISIFLYKLLVTIDERMIHNKEEEVF